MSNIVCLDFDDIYRAQQALFSLNRDSSCQIKVKLFKELFTYYDQAETEDLGGFHTSPGYFILASDIQKLADAGYEIRIDDGNFNYITVTDFSVEYLNKIAEDGF